MEQGKLSKEKMIRLELGFSSMHEFAKQMRNFII